VGVVRPPHVALALQLASREVEIRSVLPLETCMKQKSWRGLELRQARQSRCSFQWQRKRAKRNGRVDGRSRSLFGTFNDRVRSGGTQRSIRPPPMACEKSGICAVSISEACSTSLHV